MPGANLTWFGRNGQAGVTWYYLSGPLDGPLYQAGGKLSADFRYNLKGVDCFGEYAYDFIGGCGAWIGGTSIPVGGEEVQCRIQGLSFRLCPGILRRGACLVRQCRREGTGVGAGEIFGVSYRRYRIALRQG